MNEVNQEINENNEENLDEVALMLYNDDFIYSYNDNVLFNNYSEDYNINNINIEEELTNENINDEIVDSINSIDSNNVIFHSFQYDDELGADSKVNTRGEKLLSILTEKLLSDKSQLIKQNLSLNNRLSTLLKNHSNSNTGNTGNTANSNTFNNFYTKYSANPFTKVPTNEYEKEQQQFNISNTNFNNQRQSVNNQHNITNLESNNNNNDNLSKLGSKEKEDAFNQLNNLRISCAPADKSIERTPSNKLEGLVQELSALMEIFEKTKTTNIQT